MKNSLLALGLISLVSTSLEARAITRAEKSDIENTLKTYRSLGGHWASKASVLGTPQNAPNSDDPVALLDQVTKEAMESAAKECTIGYPLYRGETKGYVQYLALLKSQTGCEVMIPKDDDHPDLYRCYATALVNCTATMNSANDGAPDKIIGYN